MSCSFEKHASFFRRPRRHFANRAGRHLDLSSNISSQQFLINGVLQCRTHKSEQITQGTGTRDLPAALGRFLRAAPRLALHRPLGVLPLCTALTRSAVRSATRGCVALAAHAASVYPVPVRHTSAPTAHTRKRSSPADVKTESSAASVPLPAELIAILRRHRLSQFGDTQVAQANTLGLVFTTKNGTPLEPRNVNRAFETLCRRAGVRSIRLHDLRHSCATLLFAMGVEAATVQRILRHSSISVTTGTYVDVIEQVQRSAVAGMDSLLNPAR